MRLGSVVISSCCICGRLMQAKIGSQNLQTDRVNCDILYREFN